MALLLCFAGAAPLFALSDEEILFAVYDGVDTAASYIVTDRSLDVTLDSVERVSDGRVIVRFTVEGISTGVISEEDSRAISEAVRNAVRYEIVPNDGLTRISYIYENSVSAFADYRKGQVLNAVSDDGFKVGSLVVDSVPQEGVVSLKKLWWRDLRPGLRLEPSRRITAEVTLAMPVTFNSIGITATATWVGAMYPWQAAAKAGGFFGFNSSAPNFWFAGAGMRSVLNLDSLFPIHTNIELLGGAYAVIGSTIGSSFSLLYGADIELLFRWNANDNIGIMAGADYITLFQGNTHYYGAWIIRAGVAFSF